MDSRTGVKAAAGCLLALVLMVVAPVIGGYAMALYWGWFAPAVIAHPPVLTWRGGLAVMLLVRLPLVPMFSMVLARLPEDKRSVRVLALTEALLWGTLFAVGWCWHAVLF